MGYFFHFFKWKHILNWINSEWKILDCYIVSDLRFLLDTQAFLPETRPFLSVLSRFFQMFIVLRLYNFDCRKNNTIIPSLHAALALWLPQLVVLLFVVPPAIPAWQTLSPFANLYFTKDIPWPLYYSPHIQYAKIRIWGEGFSIL